MSSNGANVIQEATPRLSNRWILFILGSLCVVTPFAIDMYLPSFATIAQEFHTSTSRISISLSTYFVGFAIGQMLYGPLLDRYGRKRPLYVGLAAYVVCSIGCGLATDFKTLVALRFLEALGGCVAQVGAITMVRDFFPVKESAKIFSLLFLMIGTSPLLAPTIGSAIVTGLGWRWIFGVLASIAFVILIMVFTLLPEGHEPDHSVSLWPRHILLGFWNIFRNPQFLTYTLAGGFSFAGLLGFVAGSPIIFIDGYHVSARAFGIIFAVLVLGFIGGNQLNVVLLHRFHSQKIFLTALLMQVFVGAFFLAGSRLNLLNFDSTMVLFFLFLSAIGLTYPNGAALALAPFSQDAGRASALLGFLQTSIGAAVALGVGFAGVQAVILLLSVTAALALGILLLGRKIIGQPVETEGDVVVLH